MIARCDSSERSYRRASSGSTAGPRARSPSTFTSGKRRGSNPSPPPVARVGAAILVWARSGGTVTSKVIAAIVAARGRRMAGPPEMDGRLDFNMGLSRRKVPKAAASFESSPRHQPSPGGDRASLGSWRRLGNPDHDDADEVEAQ